MIIKQLLDKNDLKQLLNTYEAVFKQLFDSYDAVLTKFQATD